MSKQVYKLPPCPVWQTDTMERWLEDLAAEGLILSRDGFFMGIGIFDRGEPVQMRFRLEPAELPVGILADGEPDKVEFHTDLGWNYHDTRGQYHIYSTADPDLPELHTDPEIEAYVLQKTRKRLRGNLINMICWILLMPIIRIRFQFLRAFLSAGTPVFLAFCWLWLQPFVSRWRELRYLRRKIRSVQSMDAPVRQPPQNWPRRTAWYTLRRVLVTVCICLVLFGMARYADVQDARKIALKDFDGELPFPTMNDFSGSSHFEPLFDSKTYNYVQFMSDIAAPEIIHFHQTGDAGTVDGGLTVEYYELRFPWMAKQLAWEYKMYAKRNMWMSKTRTYTELELPPLDVDYAEAFTDIFPSVVMYEGNKLIYVYFYQTTQNQMPIEEWVVPFAEALKVE